MSQRQGTPFNNCLLASLTPSSSSGTPQSCSDITFSTWAPGQLGAEVGRVPGHIAGRNACPARPVPCPPEALGEGSLPPTGCLRVQLPREGTKRQGKSPGYFPGKSQPSPAPSTLSGLILAQEERGFLSPVSDRHSGPLICPNPALTVTRSCCSHGARSFQEADEAAPTQVMRSPQASAHCTQRIREQIIPQASAHHTPRTKDMQKVRHDQWEGRTTIFFPFPPGPLFEGNPVGEGTTRRGTATPVHRPQRPAGSTHSSTGGLRSPTPRPWRPDFRGTTGVSLSSQSYFVRNPTVGPKLETWVFSSCGASIRFLTRYNGELREPLVWC